MSSKRAEAQVLARAFHDDPMFTFIAPSADRRRRVLPWFFGAALRLGDQQGRVDTDAGRAAVIWLPPGRTSLGPGALLRSGLALAPIRLGPSAFGRFTRLTSAFEKSAATVHGTTYWHLFILGVDPSVQGQGVGVRLVAPVLAEADAAGHLCYLETLSERNLAFYQRLGFTVAGHVTAPGLPEFWMMTRAPRTD
ncbi:GNAT family N-acetyltransferase [Cryptosporangium aurantiacum]|uniref:Acetyltransferase (GNAT) family protein n=1 Tax=Cryptosporangium aurantiacum TaxID=134849 RepID=A0A1M7R2B9_9ACTN|nr:GNAT family N-acetyltransferase [Cryptosporangium aurantiacum]SHN38969.1 Acetyltransferase (GNAT) family protein [Cryptosporangium aurantiacum]